jgi:hypothetical protein
MWVSPLLRVFKAGAKGHEPCPDMTGVCGYWPARRAAGLGHLTLRLSLT